MGFYFSLPSIAAQYFVRGTVKTAIDKENVPGAVYKIFLETDTVNPEVFNVTDIDGNFSSKLKAPANYIIKIDYSGTRERSVSFNITDNNPEVDLGEILLLPEDEMLQEVVVTAKKKLIQSDGATLTYNVEDDPEAQVNSTIEMLRKVPMVTVDAEDNIKVNGDSNFKILVNGKEDPMLSGDIKTVLKAMPAATIKKIEVITEPGAKYDAEGTGGILNIVTVGKQSLDGFMTNLSFRIANNNYGVSGYGRTKINNVTASANINYVKSMDEGFSFTGKSLLENLTDDDNRFQYSDSKSKNSFDYLGANLNLSWEPDTLNLFTIQGNFGKNNFGQTSHSLIYMENINSISQWEMRQNNFSNYKNLWIGANASFQHTFGKQGHHLIFSYIFGYGDVNSDQTNFSFDEINYDIFPWRMQENSGYSIRNTFQIDYSNPITEKHLLEAGFKGNWQRDNSDNSPFYGSSQENLSENLSERMSVGQFQDIMAAYISYTGNFGKCNTRAGIRYEYTRMGLKYKIGDYPDFTTHLNDIVPNLAISYKITDASNLRLAYQMRISRPGISQLNPYHDTMSINRDDYGNPDLDSEKSNSVSLTYSNYGGRLGGSFGLSYDRVDNAIVNYGFMAENVMNNTYANIGHRQQTRANLNLQWSVIPMLNLGVYLSGSYIDIKADSPELKQSNSGWSGNYNINADYTFPFKLRLSAYGGGGSGWINLQTKSDGFYYYGLSLSRSFLKNDILTITAYGSNFLTPYRSFHNTQTSESFNSFNDYRFKQWSAGGSITFRFGSLRHDVKRTAADLEMMGGASQTGANTPEGAMQGM